MVRQAVDGQAVGCGPRPSRFGPLPAGFDQGSAASTHASSHPAAGLDATRETAQALAHGASAALTGAAVILGIALVVALVTAGRRRTQPAAADTEPASADTTQAARQELDTGTH